jgi:hypothetical protein
MSKRFTVYVCATILIVISFCGIVWVGSIRNAESLLKSPQPAVDFIEYLVPYPGEVGSLSGLFCISLRPEEVYEPGDKFRDFDKKWPSLFRLSLNSNPIPLADMNLIDNLSSINGYEGRDAILNIHGCWKGRFGPGLHVATVKVTSMSGKVSTYSWAFRADSIDPQKARGIAEITYGS